MSLASHVFETYFSGRCKTLQVLPKTIELSERFLLIREKAPMARVERLLRPVAKITVPSNTTVFSVLLRYANTGADTIYLAHICV